MANITDPTAIRFSNEKLRTACDYIMKAYWIVKAMQLDISANPSLATLIPNDGMAEIIDGARQDGRTVITGADANLAFTNFTALVNTMEAASSAVLKSYDKIAVNPRP